MTDDGLAALRAEIKGWMEAHLAGRFAPLRFRGNSGDGECAGSCERHCRTRNSGNGSMA